MLFHISHIAFDKCRNHFFCNEYLICLNINFQDENSRILSYRRHYFDTYKGCIHTIQSFKKTLMSPIDCYRVHTTQNIEYNSIPGSLKQCILVHIKKRNIYRSTGVQISIEITPKSSAFYDECSLQNVNNFRYLSIKNFATLVLVSNRRMVLSSFQRSSCSPMYILFLFSFAFDSLFRLFSSESVNFLFGPRFKFVSDILLDCCACVTIRVQSRVICIRESS